MMFVYRLTTEDYADKLTASGIANRWNRAGQYVIYAGASRSLATLELLVHRSAVRLNRKYKVMVIRIPNKSTLIKKVNIKDLPENWRTMRGYTALQKIGGDWYDNEESLILEIPSAVLPKESNFMINTKHPDFKKLVNLEHLEPYFWDDRLFEAF